MLLPSTSSLPLWPLRWVAAAFLVRCEAPRDDVLELADEVQELRRVVQRLARGHYVGPGQLCRYSSRKACC